MAKLVLTLPALYKDNSLHKEGIKKKILEQRVDKLERKLEKTRVNKRKLSLVIEKEELKALTIEKIKEEIYSRSVLIEKMNQAARFIQKRSREVKDRRGAEDGLISEIEDRMKHNLGVLEEISYFAFWNLGNAAENASNLIKRSYRRSKFRQKIERIRKVYKLIVKNNKTLCRFTLRKAMRTFRCKMLITKALHAKEKKILLEKCKAIRIRLALITISQYWKTNKLNYRKFMYKCRKFKRLISRQKGRFLSAGTIFSEFSSYMSTPRNEELTQNQIKEIEYANLAALKLLQEREQKLNTTRISYNIKKFKEKKIPRLNLSSISEQESKAKGLSSNLHSKIGFSSKTIAYCNIQGKSNRSIGALSTRSTSNQAKIFRFV